MYTFAMIGLVMLLLVSGLGGIQHVEASPAMQWQFAYDDAGRMVKAVDPAGRQTTRRYELGDNKRVRSIVQELPDTSRVTYAFDPRGRPISMTDADGIVRCAHDGFGRLLTVQRDGTPVISYTYDTLNRLRSSSVGKGWTILYTYDFLGRLAEIGTPVGKIVYEYRNGQGTIVRTLPNGIRTIWTYRPDGNLESIAHVSQANKLLRQFTYTYRPDGLISDIKERSPDGEKQLTYIYDTMQRLMAVADPQHGTTHFHYDKFANRTEVRYPGGQVVLSAYDWAGRLLRHADQETAHDAAGNLTAYASPQGHKAFEHNVMNLLQTASTPAGKVHYQYDGNGALIARTTGAQTTSFVVDPLADIWRPLLATHGQGKQTYYIAGEALSQSPEGCGVHAPVAVFTELQRIAMLAAMAESLRDQGVPLPAWMRDYPVQPCPVAATTPAIVVAASQTDTQPTATGTVERTLTQPIYGGVNLSPADSAVHTIAARPQVDALAATLQQAVAAAPELSAVAFRDHGKPYRALALPGDNTRALAANRLQEADLVVPVQHGTTIRLTRHFHSFFQPMDMFGQAWTLDLPRLVEQRRPVQRTGDTVARKTTYHLTSPLNTVSANFTEQQFVSDVNATVLVPDDSSDILGLGSAEDEQIGFPTRVVLFRDGRRWYFDAAGNLAAVKQTPLAMVYRWDSEHHLQRLEGWYGKALRADIRLEYNPLGRVTRAHASDGTSVTYTYNTTGMLVRVQSPEGIRDYTYQDGLVTEVAQDGQVVHRFAYNDRGQLQRERHADGTETAYQVAARPDGVTVAAQSSGSPQAQETVQYDTALRPVHRVFADGTRLQWRYDDHGTTETHLILPEGERYMVSHTADNRQRTWHMPAAGTYRAEYDAAGRVASLWQGDSSRLRLQWDKDGQLALATSETAALHPEYRADGFLSGLLVTPPEKGPRFSRWFHVTYDEPGRAAHVQDYTGADIRLGYDSTGRLAGLDSPRGGIQLQRDAWGRVLTVRTSWGSRQENTYDSQSGALKKTTFTRDGHTAVIEFDQGKPTRVQGFDGGALRIAYYDRGFHKGRIQQVRTPNDLVCTYEYDAENRLTVVQCGAGYRLEFTYDIDNRLAGVAQVPIRP